MCSEPLGHDDTRHAAFLVEQDLALGEIEVEPMPDEIPTETSELDGQVLLLLGTAQVDQPLVDPDS